MKNVLRKVLIGIAILFFIVWSYLSFTHLPWEDNKTITRCGTVEQVMNGERAGKYHMITELYLGVRFKSGEFEAVNVDPTTYMQKKVGDRVCFSEYDTSDRILYLFSSMYFLILGMVCLVLLVLSVVRVFKEEEKE